MNPEFLNYLATKGILVGEERCEDAFAYTFAMARLFGVRITKGAQLATRRHIEILSACFGENVPSAFYRGFPQSVRALSPEARYFDQLLHYTLTYGFGNFDAPGYSAFEKDFERAAFSENVEVRDFCIVDTQTARRMLSEFVSGMLLGSRPLPEYQYAVALAYVKEYGAHGLRVASKNTAIRLLIDTENDAFSSHLMLSDVIKAAGEIAYRKYGQSNIKKLNLKNRDRRLLTSLIRRTINEGRADLAECYEKKALWCGLLHHLHFKPENDAQREFLDAMHGRENGSVYAQVERALAEGRVGYAAELLYASKGGGGVLREMNHLISRARCTEDILSVLSHVEARPILLVQLLLQYTNYKSEGKRTFRFTRFGKVCVHTESDDEQSRRRSLLNKEAARLLSLWCEDKLAALLRGRVGKVYIDPLMYRIALPISEGATAGGLGVLPRGSRLCLPEGKKLRAFTYWERVNDIDLSVQGIDDAGEMYEFSWRTMWNRQSDAITFSGDQTAGFLGGSEYYDVDLDAFCKKYPKIRYLIFANNVFSHLTFDECVCRAGYMMRDRVDSGEIFEARTVKSSFAINVHSTFAYLFGIDLEKRELVWLNLANDSYSHIAALSDASFLTDYFTVCDKASVGRFFEMMATELVSDPMEADVVLSGDTLPCREDAVLIRPCDFERILSYLE